MPQEIVILGFTCPACLRKVPVIRSCESPPKLTDRLIAQCRCGFIRPIPFNRIQQLEIWKETPSSNDVAAD